MQNTRQVLRIGLIGLGKQGKKHLRALLELNKQNRIKLVATCDIDSTLAIKGIKHFISYNSLLTSKFIDAIIIATPNILHKDITLTALTDNIHVVKEKPLAINYRDGKEIIALAKKMNLLVITTQQRKYNSLFIKTKDIVKRLHEPYKFNYTFTINDTIESWYWNKKIAGGGSWLNMGWHAVSMIQWLIGSTDLVTLNLEIGGKRPWVYNTDHTAQASILINKINTGSIFVSCIESKKETLKIIANNGYLMLRRNSLTAKINNKKYYTTHTSTDEKQYLDQLKAVVSCLENGDYNMNIDLMVLKTISEGINYFKSVK